MANILYWLSGTWFIISTNFPMWLKGDKQSPEFHYTVTKKNGKQVLLDQVTYLKKGHTKTITGFDNPDPQNDKGFTWRGKGLLAIARSKWEIRLMDEQEGWAVIYFSKTLFTPEGADIISRNGSLDEATLQKIKAKMLQDSVLVKQVNNLVRLRK